MADEREEPNDPFDKAALRSANLPEDTKLTEHQAYWLMVSLLEDDD